MKKIFITIFSYILLSSCISDDRYEEYNQNAKSPTEANADFLFNASMRSLVDQMTETNVNRNVFRLLAQYWTQTTYIDESNFDLTRRTIPQYHWSEMYGDVLFDLETAKEYVMSDDDPEVSEGDKIARMAQIEILLVYTWQQLVDTFGDIPYSEALSPRDIPLPVYDDAAAIYADLIERLENAITDLSSGEGFSIDNLYYGNMDAWQTFAHSLKLRLGIRLSDVDPSTAQSIVESAYNEGVFTSNADNASFVYLGSSNPNPVWSALVQSGRNDFIPANTIVDFMNNLDDPRRSAYFDDNLGADTYVGGIYGDNNTFSIYTHIGGAMHDPVNPACLMDYAEVSFYLAEAAARGWSVGGTVEEHYNNGIMASFDYWGIPGVADYLANPDIAYATAPGADWREKIGNQFWLAMYNRGFEGWTVWRKYDTPTFNLPAKTESPVPTRYTYPVNEQNLNETNRNNAASAIGGDEQTTRLFWDVN